jgi:hypothetical protein
MDRSSDPHTDVRTDDDVHIIEDPRTGTATTDTGTRVVAAPIAAPPRVDRDRTILEDRDPYDGIREAKDRFGGLDIPAILSGMLVGLAMLVILAGLASAAFGEIAFQTGVSGNEAELSTGALITAGLVIFLSFLIGGWAAGRMSRYSGALNGFMVALTFVIFLGVLAALGAIVGDQYNLFDNLRVAKADLPNWFSAETVTTAAIVSSIAFAVVTFLGATLGGVWGGRLHRRADRIIATRAASGDRVIREETDTTRRI